MPKAIILVTYGAQPYDNKDELTQAKGNDTHAIRRTAMDGKDEVTRAKSNNAVYTFNIHFYTKYPLQKSCNDSSLIQQTSKI